ncbi:hypothetical protein DVH05_003149 [Phytophthora capsici]|nr:hypothetical protein DVH05_003149 [Phytophthora capsici]|eukprot:jgi/Phyca11/571374/estExt2_Genewise1.C_PHYCAscaffold_420063
MKTATFLLLATVGVATAQNETQSCDLGAIEGSLLPNGTQWHDSCVAATGVDVFNMEGELPTEEEAEKVQQSRDCVNYLNQINQQANSMIQCETTVGDQSVNFGSLLTDLLKGQSSNKTKEAEVGSDSMSGSVSLSASDSESESTSKSESASGSESESASGSEEISSGSADAQASGSASNSAGVAVTATFSIIAAAATTVLAFAL